MTEIKKNFPGGTYPQRNVAERAFYDLGWVEFAYGVPVGSQLEYADEVTLSRALEGRQEI